MALETHGEISVRKVSVRDFGPIKSADVSLGNVTFLVGPQNTGKTYLATLIAMLAKEVAPLLSNQIIGGVADYYRKGSVSGTISYKEIIESPKRDEYLRAIQQIQYVTAGYLDGQFRRYYLTERPGQLIRSGQSSSTIDAEFRMDETELADLSIRLTADGFTAGLVFNPAGVWKALEYLRPQMTFVGAPSGITSFGYGGTIRAFALYIPAERFMIVPVFGQVVNLVLSVYRGLQPGQPFTPGLGQFNMRQTLFDYLSILSSALDKTATYKVMDMGSVVVSARSVVFDDPLHDGRFPITSVGSGLAQLAGIVIPIEALNPTFVVIEEPEVNLHADAQVKVGEYIGSLVDSGARRVVITTHSHYLVAKLALQYAKGQIPKLEGYYIESETGMVEHLPISKETGSVELPRSIEKALEGLAKEAMKLTGESK